MFQALIVQQNILVFNMSSSCSNIFLLIYDHYYHLPKTNSSLTLIKHMLQEKHCLFRLSSCQQLICLNNHNISTYNLVHNILEFYNVLVQIRLATSKTTRGIQYSKLGIRVVIQVAEQLKTQNLRKEENIRKISNLGGAQRPVSLPQIKLWRQQSKKRKSRCQTFLYQSSFTGFLYFAPNVLPRIV